MEIIPERKMGLSLVNVFNPNGTISTSEDSKNYL